jgi:hypothetical protein
MRDNNLALFNTVASYGLRYCIVVQVAIVAVVSLFKSDFQQHFRGYQQAHLIALLLIIVFLLADVVTPASARRPRSKKVDLTCFLVWLVSFASLLGWGLMHCSDC